MSAGLPGLGLGGLFFIFSALWAPFPELWRTVRGRSGLAAWRVIGRQFAQAATMVAAIDLTLRFSYLALSELGVGDPPPADAGTVLPLTLIGITSALLLAVVAGAKLAELVGRVRFPVIPRVPDAVPRPAPLRVLALGGTAAVAWVTLLAVGASELSPLNRPHRHQTVEPGFEVARGRASRSAGPHRPRVSDDPPATVVAVPREARGGGPGEDLGQESQGEDAGAPPVKPPPPPPSPVPPLSPSAPAAAAPPVAPAPPVASPVSTPPNQASGAPPHPATPPPASAEHGVGPPPGEPPDPAGPPAQAGPPEGSSAPEQSGPPPHAGRG